MTTKRAERREEKLNREMQRNMENFAAAYRWTKCCLCVCVSAVTTGGENLERWWRGASGFGNHRAAIDCRHRRRCRRYNLLLLLLFLASAVAHGLLAALALLLLLLPLLLP